MATTLTLWREVVVNCETCDVDLARVTAREDFDEQLNGTVGAVIIRHMKETRHGAHARSVREMTWDELVAARDGHP